MESKHKKKVGIMTYHRALNEGAMLQAFALQQVLSDKYDTHIVDYRCQAIENAYYPQKGLRSRIKYCLRWFVKYNRAKFSYEKRKNFRAFEKNYLKESKKIYTPLNIESANSNFDAFIAGSDQVWNPQISNGDLNYFLAFAESKKKYSYAGSFGRKSCVCEHPSKERISDLLSDIKAPLIREEEGFEIMNELNVRTRENAALVCDPVFLLKEEEWINKLSLVPQKGNYILLFLVSEGTYAVEFAKNLAETFHLEVRYINSSGNHTDCPSWCVDNMTVGPREFLEILTGAKYVVTTSFHGMSFSLIFHKQFFYELSGSAENKNSRLETLASIFEVQDREIKSPSHNSEKMEIDYAKINPIVCKYAGRSRELLFETLKELDWYGFA